MRIPETVEELNADWLRSALRLGRLDLDVVDAQIVEVMQGTCTKIRVALSYGGGPAGPATMILKGGFASHSAAFLDMHETEMRFYRDIAPRISLSTPRCFFAGVDPDSRRSAVLIEDLDARGVRWLTALEPLSWRDEVAFIDALAALAAEWWNSPELAPDGTFDWLITSYEREAAVYIDHYLESDRWAGFMTLPRCACLPRSLHDRDRMAAALAALAQRMAVQPLTMSHGDTHLGNLYLAADGTPGFLDAQPRRAPWVKDFAYHMVAALDIEDRRQWERPLLARYLRALEAAGIHSAPSFDEAFYDYRCELAYGLFIFMINEGHFQREEINTACTSRFGAAVVDHGTMNLLR